MPRHKVAAFQAASALLLYTIVCLTTYDLLGYCRLRRQPFTPIAYTFLMYLYHFISIDLESSRLCNSLHCKAYKSLSPKLKNFLISIDLLGALNAYTNVINKQYNNILYLTPKSVF